MPNPEAIIAAVAAKRQLDSYKVTALATSIHMKNLSGLPTDDPEIKSAVASLRSAAQILEDKGL